MLLAKAIAALILQRVAAAVGERVVDELVGIGDDHGVIGYVRGDDLLAEKADPSRHTAALAVYGPDGVTLIGFELPDVGFVASTSLLEYERAQPAPIPKGDSPFG